MNCKNKYFHKDLSFIHHILINLFTVISILSSSDKAPDAGPRRPMAGRVADRRCSVLRPRPDLSEVDASLANSRRNRPCENGARKRDGGGAAVGQLTYVSAAGRRVRT